MDSNKLQRQFPSTHALLQSTRVSGYKLTNAHILRVAGYKRSNIGAYIKRFTKEAIAPRPGLFKIYAGILSVTSISVVIAN